MRGVIIAFSPAFSDRCGAGRRFNPAGWPSTVGAEQGALWAALAHRLSNSLVVPVFTDFFSFLSNRARA